MFIKVSDSYSFDTTNNLLTIKSNALKFITNRQYEIFATTQYLGSEYYQKIRINIQKDRIETNTVIEYDCFICLNLNFQISSYMFHYF